MLATNALEFSDIAASGAVLGGRAWVTGSERVSPVLSPPSQAVSIKIMGKLKDDNTLMHFIYD